MLTGRSNYTDFNQRYHELWSENVDLIEHPELLSEPKYSVRSAVLYWLKHELYNKGDNGATGEVVNSITAVINEGTDSYSDRRSHFNRAYTRPLAKVATVHK